MQVLTGRNVNALWPQGMMLLDQHGESSESRNGPVLVAPWPVMSVYERPQERVLFDPVRDANPFFHLMESLWMLAGRDDAGFLNRYVSDFGSRYGDGPNENRYIHGAYGKRWRTGMGIDQLVVVVNKLRANPSDRQAVIQMWDAADFANGGHADLGMNWKDRPCNTHVYLRVRKQHAIRGGEPTWDSVLDLTVCCRSNDVVWGAYGANAVHFSVLQEYLAGRIGVGIGKMYQLSNNFHGYVGVLQKHGDPMLMHLATDPYATGEVRSEPMGFVWELWDADLAAFMKWHDGWLALEPTDDFGPDCTFANGWFDDVAAPVAVANHMWKRGMRERALEVAWDIAAPDWRLACVNWIKRRMK